MDVIESGALMKMDVIPIRFWREKEVYIHNLDIMAFLMK
jgi:hypothetical protein